jgi:hypothetical protein
MVRRCIPLLSAGKRLGLSKIGIREEEPANVTFEVLLLMNKAK